MDGENDFITADEARKTVIDNENIIADSEWETIKELINEAITKRDYTTWTNGQITNKNEQKLRNLGYSVRKIIDNHRNCTIIKW